MAFWDKAKDLVKTGVGYAVGGPVGALVGGGGKLLGGAARGFGGQTSYNASIAPINQGQANSDLILANRARQQQNNLASVLQRRVAGQAPSVAARQGQYGIAQAFQNASRIAANARGVNRGLALRAGANAATEGMAQANRDATLLRAQEQMAAEQTLGQQLAQVRAQDLQTRAGSLEAARADQAGQIAEQNINADIATGNAARGQKGWGAALSAAGGFIASDIRVKEDVAPATGSFGERLATLKPSPSAIQAGYQAGEGARQAGVSREQSRPAVDPSQEDSPTASMAASPGIREAFAKGLMSAGGGLMSDKRVKEDLAPVQPYTYRYKPEMAASMAEKLAASAPPDRQEETYEAAFEDAREPRQGVMTQELLKSPRGKKLVVNTPQGQAIEGRRALSFVLANQAGLDKRLAKLEGARV